MSFSDENYPHHPEFDRPDGVASYREEETLPFADLYSEPENQGDTSGGSARSGQPSPDPYGSDGHGGGGHYQSQYANPPYAPQPAWDPNQHTMATPPPPQPQYGYYAYAPVEHPQSTAVLVLALVGFAVPVTPFIAWYMGSKAKAEIERGAPFPYSGSLKVGHIIGKVMSILMLAGIGLYAIVLIFLLTMLPFASV